MGFSRLEGLTAHFCWFESQRLPGFRPLQRHHQRFATAKIPAFALSVPRFSQPHNEPTSPWLVGLFHPTGTPRVMSSESDPRSIGTRFQVHAPTSLSASQGFHHDVTTCPHSQDNPPGFTRWDSSRTGLLVSCETGSPLRLGPTLKLCSRSGAFWYRPRFHPPTAEQLS